MHIHRKSLYVFRFCVDIVAIIIAYAGAAHCFAVHNAINLTNRDYSLSFSLILIWFFSARITNLYDEFRSRTFGYEFIGLVRNILIQVIAAILILFLIKTHPLSRSFVLLYAMGLLVNYHNRCNLNNYQTFYA